MPSVNNALNRSWPFFEWASIVSVWVITAYIPLFTNAFKFLTEITILLVNLYHNNNKKPLVNQSVQVDYYE